MIDWHCTSEDVQAYVDGELDGAPLQLAEEHIERCEGCARLAGHLLMLSQSLGAVSPDAPPAGLRERVMSAVARAEGVEALDCVTSREMISAYLDDELVDAARDQLEAHVFVCAECYAHLRRTQGMVESLRVIAPAAAPAGLHEGILAAVERSARPAPIFTWRRVAVAAASVAAGVAIWISTVVPAVTTAPAPVIAAAPAVPIVEAPAPADVTVPTVTTPHRTVTPGSATRVALTVAPIATPADTTPAAVTPAAEVIASIPTPTLATPVEERVTVPAADLVVPAPVVRPIG